MDVTKVDISAIVGHTCEISLFFPSKVNVLFRGLVPKTGAHRYTYRIAFLYCGNGGLVRSLREAATRVWDVTPVVVVIMTKVPMAQEEAHHVVEGRRKPPPPPQQHIS